MRFAERFLVAFAIIALVMRYAGLKDGPTMELIALPLLALCYVIAFPVWMKRGSGKAAIARFIASLISGLIVAYCILSAMFYTLGWLPKRDMLENCCLLSGILIFALTLGWRRYGDVRLGQILLRVAILLSLLLLLGLLPLPQIAAGH